MASKSIMLLAGVAALGAFAVNEAYAADREFRIAAGELSTVSGAHEVYSRIHEVAYEVCAEKYGGHRLVKHRTARERCTADLIEELVAEVDHPLLYQVYAAGGEI